MKNIFLAIAMLISVAGYSQIQSVSLTASGLTCSMCSKAIYKALLKVPGIKSVDVNIEKSSYEITFDKGATVSPEALKNAVEGAGFAVAQLDVMATLPKTTISSGTKITLQGSTYQFVKANGQTVQGVQKLTVIDKAYLSSAQWKRYVKELPVKRENGVFLVTL